MNNKLVDIVITSGAWSIEPMEWSQVPPFAVITGHNGAGKSHLLQVLATSLTGLARGRLTSGEKSPSVRIVGDAFQRDEVVYQTTWDSNLSVGNLDFGKVSDELKQLHKKVLTANSGTDSLALIVAERLGRNASTVSFEDFVSALPEEYTYYTNKTNFGLQGLYKAITLYRLKTIESIAQGAVPNEIEGILGQSPWDTMNEIFRSAQFPYRLKVSDKLSIISVIQPPALFDSNRGIEILPDSLSSGEKVILGVALLMYRSNFPGVLPRLMLLDEPDAHLHPSMNKQLVDVLRDVIVGRLGVRVIMTTHSPSTIAFAPEESIYTMSSTEPRLQKTTRNQAMRELTAGLLLVGPHVRHVIVEGDDDAQFYKLLVELLLTSAHETHLPLTFMPVRSREGAAGGKNLVVDWVGKLRAEVDGRFVGIIDRDSDNKPTTGVSVLERHSLENYLLDPLVVFTIWMEEGLSISESGLSYQLGDETDFRNRSPEELQVFVDWVLAQIKAHFEELDWSIQEVAYSPGLKLQYPRWLLYHRGKDLLTRFQRFRGGPASVNPRRLLLAYRRIRMIPHEMKVMFEELATA